MPTTLNNDYPSKIEQINDSRASQPNQPYLYDLDNNEKFTFQNIPQNLSIDPESTFAILEAPGRNAPIYHFTGAETTISFELSYYAAFDHRQDVIMRCKWLEALSMNDEYLHRVHHVAFGWGDLFNGYKFIVTSAKYKLALFDRQYQMLPKFAQQTVTLKRISDVAIGRKDILYPPPIGLFAKPKILSENQNNDVIIPPPNTP